MEYKARVADAMLERKLRGKGAVLIQGAKWCGKTTTAEHMAKSVICMDDPQRKSMYLQMAEMNMKRLLSGDTPHLIDEWQLAPQIWDEVRYEVDHRENLGQFILTGSAVPADRSRIDHSGTGRFSWLTMRPMSLWESGDSTGEVSLGQLLREQKRWMVIRNTLSENIDTTKMKKPAFKMILTATGNYAYRLKNEDIFVVPIGCLKP